MSSIKYITHPAYTLLQWQSRNPILYDGEIALIKDGTNKVTNMKIGPGAFNDLPYYGAGSYPYEDLVTNQLGDAVGSLIGKTTNEILKLILSPYQVPVLSAPRNNMGMVGGPLSETQIKEIGSSLNVNVQVQYNASNASNLSGATPINVNSQGAFSNDGDFANGSINLVPAGAISPTLPTTIEIKLKGTHTNGETNEVITFIQWKPRAIAGCSALETLTSDADVNAMTAKHTQLTDTPEIDVFLGQGKFHWILIPGMLMGVETLIFTDRSNPEAPTTVEFVAKGAIMHNNGVGNYSYQMYRSPFYLTVSSSRYRVRKNV